MLEEAPGLDGSLNEMVICGGGRLVEVMLQVSEFCSVLEEESAGVSP